MRKITSVSLLLSLLFLTAFTIHAQSRPRRVGDTATTQQTEPPNTEPQQPAQTQSTQKRPVLQTGTTIQSSSRNPSSSQKPQSSTPTSNDPEEVGEGDVVRVNTTLVSIPVSVMDRDGRFIPDLRKEEFQIFEDGVQQNVSYFVSVEKPFTVALVIDTSASTHFRMDEMQDAAIAFVNQLRPDDRVMVVSFDSRVRLLQDVTNDHNLLRDAIRSTRTGGNTRLYDAMDLVMKRLNQLSGRKAIVLFTDGVDTTSKDAKYEDNMRDAEELDALIYPVQYDTYNDVAGAGGGGGSWPSSGGSYPRSSGSILIDILGGIMGGGRGGYGRGGGGGGGAPGSSREDYKRADTYLHDLAYKTGGHVFQAETTRDLSQSFANIAEELRRQYSLGYYPKTQAQAGQRRQIKVRVLRPDLVVRARDSYIVGASSANANAQGNTQQSKPVLQKHQLAATQ